MKKIFVLQIKRQNVSSVSYIFKFSKWYYENNRNQDAVEYMGLVGMGGGGWRQKIQNFECQYKLS